MNIRLPAAAGLSILAELYAEDRIDALDDVTMTPTEWEHAQQLFGLVLDSGTPNASIFGVPVHWTTDSINDTEPGRAAGVHQPDPTPSRSSERR